MKKKSLVTMIMVFIITIVALGSPINANDDLQNLEDQKQQIDTKIEETNQELLNIQSEMTDTLKQIQQLNQTMEDYQGQADELNEKLVDLQSSIKETEAKLQISENNYIAQKNALEERLVALYESGETTYLDVLLKSTSLSSFISNCYLITELAQNDMDSLAEIEREKKQIETERQVLGSKKEQTKALKEKALKVTTVLENTKIVHTNYMNKLTDREKQVQSTLDQYEQESKRVEEEIQAAIAASIIPDYIGGEFAWPAPGYTRITSPFGMRTHPITGVYKLHTGMDIGAPYGSNFIAANDGVVISAGYNTAYGKMVVIDHGGGISTLYAHGSEIMVSVGQSVRRGDVVLKVGSTGYSTGPHAHFEVRVNGQYVDPMTYFTATNANE